MWKRTPIMSDQNWLNQFAESAEVQRNKRQHLHKKYGSGVLF